MLGKIIAFIAVAAVAVDACSYPIVPSAGCVPSCLPTVYPDVAPALALTGAVASLSACGYPGVVPSACGYPGVVPSACGYPGVLSTACGYPGVVPSACGYPGALPYGYDAGLYGTSFGVSPFLGALTAPYYGCGC